MVLIDYKTNKQVTAECVDGPRQQVKLGTINHSHENKKADFELSLRCYY